MAGKQERAETPTKRYSLPGLETRTGLAAFEGGLFLLIGAVLAWSADVAGEKTTAVTWAALGCAIFGWTVFQSARLVRLRQLQDRERPEKVAPEGRRLLLSELYVWLFVSLIVLSGIVLAQRTYGGFGFLELGKPAGLTAFMGLMALSFVPAGMGVLQTERALAAERTDHKILREDAISAGSLFAGLFAMGLIVLLAWAAARDAFITLGQNMGVIVTLFVMFAFLFFIVLSSVTRGMNLFQEREKAPVAASTFAPTASLAKLASWADSILVRILAPMTGATQAPDGRHGLGWHHVFMIGIFAPLSLLGYALPQPWGLIPIGAAFLFALSIGRRWAWVEGDRETASRLRTTKGSEIHVGFANDLRDEALLGYSFLFVLVPLTLFQLNDMTGAFCLRGTEVDGRLACRIGGGDGSFDDWIGFFGLELFKAVPLVDWAEIYGLESKPNIIANGENDLAKHLVFGARVLVDFVVMAALFQAISIFQRNHTQRKLYDSGQLDVLDPITEEDFFETGMIKASKGDFDLWAALSPQKQMENPVIALEDGKYFTAKDSFLQRVESHVRQQRSTGKIEWPYDRDRLNELVSDPRQDVRAGSRWMIRKYGLLAGDPRNQVSQLADRWQHIQLPVAREEIVFVEKQNFEDVVKSVQRNPRDFSNAELGRLSYLMRETCNRPEFSFAHMQAFKLIGLLKTRSAVRLIAASVLKIDQVAASETWKTELQEEFGFGSHQLRQGLDEMRVHAYAALETMAKKGLESPSYGVGASTYRLALELAEFASTSEAAKSKAVAMRAREALIAVLAVASADAGKSV